MSRVICCMNWILSGVFENIIFTPFIFQSVPDLRQTNSGDSGPCEILLIRIIDTQLFRKPLIDKTLTFTFAEFFLTLYFG